MQQSVESMCGRHSHLANVQILSVPGVCVCVCNLLKIVHLAVSLTQHKVVSDMGQM